MVEFKRGLSGKNGFDPWHDGADKFADGARDKIANELIAFANAHGGTLVLGVAESKDSPPRAESITPVPRCAVLAQRLSQAIAAVIEPPLMPFPSIVPIEIDGDAGVVIFQVARSLNAPHRHRTSLQSFIRRGEEAAPMTMREIQDLTLQVERGLTLVEKQFSESAARFNSSARPSIGLALRATAVPLTPLSLPIPNDKTINPYLRSFRATKGKRTFEVTIPGDVYNYRPVLRGIRSVDRRDDGHISVEIRSTGFLEIFFYRLGSERTSFPADWYAGMACNALFMTDVLRLAANSPGTEYGLELEVIAPSKLIVFPNGGREFGFDDSWSIGGVVFPRYQISDQSRFGAVMELVDVDFWNAVGRRGDPPLQIEF